LNEEAGIILLDFWLESMYSQSSNGGRKNNAHRDPAYRMVIQGEDDILSFMPLNFAHSTKRKDSGTHMKTPAYRLSPVSACPGYLSSTDKEMYEDCKVRGPLLRGSSGLMFCCKLLSPTEFENSWAITCDAQSKKTAQNPIYILQVVGAGFSKYQPVTERVSTL
jgi:hypothetical protein